MLVCMPQASHGAPVSDQTQLGEVILVRGGGVTVRGGGGTGRGGGGTGRDSTVRGGGVPVQLFFQAPKALLALHWDKKRRKVARAFVYPVCPGCMLAFDKGSDCLWHVGWYVWGKYAPGTPATGLSATGMAIYTSGWMFRNWQHGRARAGMGISVHQSSRFEAWD